MRAEQSGEIGGEIDLHGLPLDHIVPRRQAGPVLRRHLPIGESAPIQPHSDHLLGGPGNQIPHQLLQGAGALRAAVDADGNGRRGQHAADVEGGGAVGRHLGGALEALPGLLQRGQLVEVVEVVGVEDEVSAGEQVDEEDEGIGAVLDELHEQVRGVRLRPQVGEERGDVQRPEGQLAVQPRLQDQIHLRRGSKIYYLQRGRRSIFEGKGGKGKGEEKWGN